ncbi:MAG TPA: hypothetical protein VFO85_15865, partial [Vicinamibacteria bacterium]|nr:hypothetical protein [Vicinamibacteria bacterium]
PLWIAEGLAELYSTAEVREKEVALGKPLAQHIVLLRDRALLPMETFLTVDHSSPHYNERDKQGIFYAQSWALAHYLLVHDTGAGRGLRPYLEATAAGATGVEACRRAFGLEPAVLQKELASYVRRLTFRYHTVPVQPLAAGHLQEKVLEPHQGAFYTGDVLAHMNRLDDARPFLEKAIERQPGFAPAYRAMGLGHAQAQDHATAVRWFNSAVEHDPQDDLARYYRARSTVLAAGPSFGPAGAATVREDFKAGLRALPHAPEAWQFLAYADSLLGRRDDEALGVLRQALRLAPDRDDLWQRLVRTHLARDEVPEAQRLAGILRARASTPEAKRAANELLMLVNAALRPRVEAGTAPDALLDDPRAARAQGVIERMDCQPGGHLEFTLRAGARTLRLRAAAPDAFMLYRDGARIQLDWTCGPLSIPVEAAFLPDEGASSGTAVRFTLVGP